MKHSVVQYICQLFDIFVANNSIQIAGVQYIYDSVIDELWKDPEKKFVSVEIEFFSHWWKELNWETKEKVVEVVNRYVCDHH